MSNFFCGVNREYDVDGIYNVNIDNLDFSLIAENPDIAMLNLKIYDDGFFIYFLGTGNAFKLNRVTLETVDSIMPIKDNSFRFFHIDENYIYCYNGATKYIYIYNKSDFELFNSYAIEGMWNPAGLYVTDNYIFTTTIISGTWVDTFNVYKYDKLTGALLNTIIDSPFNMFIGSDNDYLYTIKDSYHSNNRIMKVGIENLNVLLTSPKGHTGVFYIYDNNIYVQFNYRDSYNNTNTAFVQKIQTTNLVHTQTLYIPQTPFRVLQKLAFFENHMFALGIYDMDFHTNTFTDSFIIKSEISNISTIINDRIYENDLFFGFYFVPATISLATIQPPSGLTITNVSSTYLTLNWINNETLYINNNVIQQFSGGTWVDIATVDAGSTSYTINNLLTETIYEFRVSLVFWNSYFPSESISGTTLETPPYPKSFCDGINYIVSGTTCGNSTGTIFISNIDYLTFYDFKLEDIDGNSYELSDNAFKGLTSNYYFLSATPKPEYWSVYGKTPCTFEWIKIESTDTTLSLTQVSVQHAICQGFGRSRGRIGYVFADSYTGFTSTPDYNLKIYNTSKELVYNESATGLTSPFIFNAIPACYNAVLTNGNDCTYFIENVCLQGLNAMTVEGIDELYLTKYNSDITVNYWGLEDENYYIGGYDSNFYTSTKIKEILNYDIWYQIPLNSADASYSQQLIRGSNGITYEESIDIVVHHKDVQKWLDMIALLRDRYVIVFRDNNENWWTFGYQSGTEIRQYRLEENAYKFTFFQPAVTKLLTAISEDYVNTYIK